MSFMTTAARFSIRPAGAAWRWEIFDGSGRSLRAGQAPTRSLAAAWVVFARTQSAKGARD